MISLVFSSGWEYFLDVIQRPPGSTIFIMLLACSIGLFTTGLNLLLSDPKRMKQKQEMISDHKSKREEIEKLQDENPKKYKKEIAKWERQDQAIQKMQQSMSMQRLKPTCITFLPMIIFFTLIRGFYTTNGQQLPVAIPPMNPWDIPQLGSMMWGLSDTITKQMGMINFTAWYFLCSFTFSTTFQKIFGIRTSQSGGFGEMFQQSKYEQYKT